jgi:hypothetical protein
MATLAELVETKLSGSKMAGVNNKAEFNVAYSTGFYILIISMVQQYT